MRILSWNVNGIRAVAEKGFKDWLASDSPDILGLQETKADESQVPPEIASAPGYHSYWSLGEQKGYSGTGLLTKLQPLEVTYGFGVEKFDNEGRIIIARYPQFILYNIYFPNGQKDEERLAYKMEFYDAFLDHVEAWVGAGEDVVVMGDFNTAHAEIDLANPRANEDYSGFLPVERAWIDKFIERGYVDTFRKFHCGERDAYSWWTYRFNARANNVGWRIDYVFVNKGFADSVKDAFILPHVKGSDHCPVGIEVEV